MPIDVEYGPAPSLEGYAAAYGAGGQAAMQGQEQLDRQQVQMHQQRMQEAQFQASQLPSPRDVFHQQAQMQSAVAHTQLQALLHGTQLSQSEQIRMQRMENAVGEISASTTLNDQEKADAIMQLRTGLDPLRERMQRAQLLQHQAQTAQMQQHTAQQAQNAALLQNLFTQGTSQTAGSGEAPEYEGGATGQPRLRSINPQTGALTFDHTDEIVAQRREAALARLENQRTHQSTFVGMRNSAAHQIEQAMQHETDRAYHPLPANATPEERAARPTLYTWMTDPQLRQREFHNRLAWWEYHHRDHPGFSPIAYGQPGGNQAGGGSPEGSLEALRQMLFNPNNRPAPGAAPRPAGNPLPPGTVPIPGAVS